MKQLILENYQQQAVDWICSRQRSALFTSTGLGKTVSVLEAFMRLRKEGRVERMLVVAPMRVARWTWPGEIEKWGYDLRVCDLRTGVEDADIYTINYESMHKVPHDLPVEMVVFDELTKVKNPKGSRIKKFWPLLKKIPWRVGLTGTPASNSLLDLFGQVMVLDDGDRFSKSHFRFKQHYFKPTDFMQYNWVPKFGGRDAIYSKIEDLALVQSSEIYGDVADTDYVDVSVKLPSTARSRYKELKKEFFLQFLRQVVTAQNAAVLINKLIQLTGGHVYDVDRKPCRVHDAKVDALRKVMDEHSPLLIAANYRCEHDTLVNELGCERWDEKTSLERWNAGEIKALVAHPNSIGHGLNLQAGGHKVCWYSLPWSRELYEQFNARVARKGQGEKPLVLRLLVEDSVDDLVAEGLRAKAEEENILLNTVRRLQG